MRSLVANGQGVRLNSTVNTSELLVNIVIKAGRSNGVRPNQKVRGRMSLSPMGHVDKAPPVDRQDLSCSCC